MAEDDGPGEALALRAEGAAKRYGRRWALRECTFGIPPGRVAALAGPNGAGKSTLLHLAAGLARADAGRVLVFGGSPRDDRGALDKVGFVAQDKPLYRGFRVADLPSLIEHVRAAGLPVETTVDGDTSALPRRVDLAAYRIVQEALTNALKHSDRSGTRLLLRSQQGAVDIEVTSDGPGQATPARPGRACWPRPSPAA